MRVDGFQNIPAILKSTQVEKAPKSTPTDEKQPSTSVSLSSFGEVLQSLQRQSIQSAQGHGSRVDELRQQVKSPDFKIDHQNLASQLLDSQIINPGL